MDWLAGLDAQMERSPAFFQGKPVVADLSAAKLQGPGLRAFFHELHVRGIQVIGMEGVDPAVIAASGADLPPLLNGGRPVGGDPAEETAAAQTKTEPTSLLLDTPVRSGQCVHFPKGDVTIVGSVASGAEVIAGGSIHVYGTLRGRAVAGLSGDARARIFCRRLEAELLAIDGMYRTADDMDPALRGRPVQAWLDGSVMMIAALD
jgi:septum site-determining protein MinC